MNSDEEVAVMDCLVIGGVADGAFLRGVHVGAQRVELGHTTHLKPIATPGADPEPGRETDIYNIQTFYMPEDDDGNRVTAVGVAIVDGQSPAWAFKQLVVAYVRMKTDELTNGRKPS